MNFLKKLNIFFYLLFIISYSTMNIVKFLFDLMRPHLPDEIIDIIVFKHRCIKHPVVNLLLDYTKNLYCEYNQKTYLGLKIKSVYDKLKSKDGDINKLIKDYFGNLIKEDSERTFEKQIFNFNLSYLVDDYGYYLKRPWGKLYYNRKYDHNKVQEGKILKSWKLKRSENIINKYICRCKYKLKYYYQINEREIKIFSREISHINYESVTRDLMFLENNTLKNGEYICRCCQIDKNRLNAYCTKDKYNRSYI